MAAAILKNRKLVLSQPQFQRLQRNLARWRSSALVTVWSVPNLRFKEIEDGGAGHPNNIKITISRQRFDRSAQHMAYNDAYWSSEPGVLFTNVCTPVSVRKFCVCKFLGTCLTLFTKLCTKNPKFARSELSYDRKFFVKIASWWSYLDDWF